MKKLKNIFEIANKFKLSPLFNINQLNIPTNSNNHLNIKQTKNFNFFFRPSDWKSAISEAEKIVGYTTSFLNLRVFLSDEFSNVANHMKKLVGTGHPLLKTAQKLFLDGKQSLQMKGLVVLLVSKAAGPSLSNPIDQQMVHGIYQCQRTLAEITELIQTACFIHRSIVDDNKNNNNNNGENNKNLSNSNGFHGNSDVKHLGNKMSVLSGDFLLANASINLASLNNTKVVELISKAIKDLMQGELMRNISLFRAPPLQPITDENIYSMKKWEEFVYLTSGSLLARGCQAAVLLANHNPAIQMDAYKFGTFISYALQLKEDIASLTTTPNDDLPLHQYFAPLILFLSNHHNPENLKKELIGKTKKQIWKRIAREEEVVDELKRRCRDYGEKAALTLHRLQATDAKKALLKMAGTVANV